MAKAFGDDELPSLFTPPIEWRKPSAATFTIVESKDLQFRVECVDEDGHMANSQGLYDSETGDMIAPPGRFYRAITHVDGQLHRSRRCDSMDEAKDECEIFRLHGRFPT